MGWEEKTPVSGGFKMLYERMREMRGLRIVVECGIWDGILAGNLA